MHHFVIINNKLNTFLEWLIFCIMCFSSDAAVDTLSCFSKSRFLEMIKKQIIKGIRKSKKKKQ